MICHRAASREGKQRALGNGRDVSRLGKRQVGAAHPAEPSAMLSRMLF
jgi:hypothetical protein